MSFALTQTCVIGCRNGITESGIDGKNELGYVKSVDGHWSIATYDLSSNSRRIIPRLETKNDDEYPQWSPNGNYLLYSRGGSFTGPDIIVYEVKNNSEKNLTFEGGGASQQPQWLPDGKVCFSYPFAWAPFHGTFIMNPDGSQKKKILDSVTTQSLKKIYFYPDSYTFVYILNWSQVYKSTIDQNRNEYIGDLTQILAQPIVVQGFNPLSEELLFTYTIDGKNAVGTYNITSKITSTKLLAQNEYLFAQVTYSNDYLKIGILEQGKTDQFLSILENGIKRRLYGLTEQKPSVSFGFMPIKFSPDDKYIVYTKQITIPDQQWVRWKDEVHIVNVVTGADAFVDEGNSPCWNPKP